MGEGSNKGRYVIETNQIKLLSREKELAVGSKRFAAAFSRERGRNHVASE